MVVLLLYDGLEFLDRSDKLILRHALEVFVSKFSGSFAEPVAEPIAYIGKIEKHMISLYVVLVEFVAEFNQVFSAYEPAVPCVHVVLVKQI